MRGLRFLARASAWNSAALPLSPQKDQGSRKAENTSAGMESAPPLKHTPRFSRGGLRWRVHETVVRRRDHEQRVRPICEQDYGSNQPTPISGAESGNATD